MLHPRTDDKGKPVVIQKPHTPTALSTWTTSHELACVTPDGPIVAELHGVPFAPWADAPKSPAAWEALAQADRFPEPAFESPVGRKPAAGAVIKEPDGRIWVIAPTNGFGGYAATFPKGRLDGSTPKATALREVWEESGLRIRLTAWLIDSKRTTTFTRYYLAERVGGSPAEMGWEAQAVMLVPLAELGTVLENPADAAIIDALVAESSNHFQTGDA